MPALAIPYFVSATAVAQGWPVTFQFNRTDFPEATDVKWSFPDGGTRTGDEVTYSIYATGEKQVILTAKVNGIDKEWKIDITLREWVVESTGLAQDGTNYNGYKGSYPIFSPDGKTVYGITFNKISGLYAYDIMTGAEKWRFIPEIPSGSYNPGTVNPVNGDIYYGTTTAGQFYCVSSEGKLKWTFKDAQSMKSTAPVVSADGSIVYIADATGNVFAINAASGAKIWGTTAGNGSLAGSLLLNGNDLIVGSGDTGKTITFINAADGTEISTIALTKGATDIAGMAVSDDKKTAYVPLLGDGIASIDLASRTLIKEFHFAGNHVYAPVISSNGIVVVGSKDSRIYGLKADLSEVIWTYAHFGAESTTNNAFNYSHPCADTEGRVYFTNGQAAPFTCMTIDAATGTIIEQFTYKDHASCKQMGGNNFLDGVIYSGYIGASGNNGVLVGKYVGGTRKFWGGPGGDICGSGCVQSPLL
jgi:outer membrane protein assembly factor BamB